MANVSLKTVSRVINGEPHVREDKRLRVQEAVQKLGYRPNIAARALSGSRSYLLGFLAPEGARTYIDQLLRGVLAECKKFGYHAVVEFFDMRGDVNKRVQELCTSTALDGVVLAPGLCDMPTVIELLDSLGIAHVAISPREALQSRFIFMDDQRAAYEMTQHLLALGHERIAFVGHLGGWPFAERRLAGFRQALAEANIKVPRGYVQEGDFSYRGGQKATDTLLQFKTPPTAIFAVNDESAVGVLTSAFQHGLKVPKDLSIAGFDDTPFAVLTYPQLTTVHQPIEEMAMAATRRCIQGKDVESPDVGMLIPFEIVVRQTTAKPNQK